MENIQAATEILNVNLLFDYWSKSHPGMTKTLFFRWLSSPGIERDIFLKEHTKPQYTFQNNVIIPRIS